MVPLILCSKTKGTFCKIVRPARMPKADVDASAVVDPSHTASGVTVLLKATTANWVLSPNSATVINKKVVKKIP